MARRKLRRIVGPALGAAATAAAVIVLGGGGDDAAPAATTADTGTARVRRTTLTERATVSGTLGYADRRTAIHRLGAVPATLTASALEGSTVRRNGTLYRADDEPVRLLYGRTPMYRTLASGVSDGADVTQLERNLAALGHEPGTVDDHFDSATAAAVRRWQSASGMDRTGQVELGQIVFLPGARRIGDVKIPTGSILSSGAEVMETTSLRRVVSIDLETDKQALANAGDRVTVTLPAGRAAKGRIARVGSVAQAAEQDAGTGQDEGSDSGSQESTISVTVVLTSKRGLGRLDEAPVSVGLVSEVRRDVLTVPVTALLARVGGGYAVQLRTGARVRTVNVGTGLFADGLVEVRSPRLRTGDPVVVPREL
jgi:peptidoglycan hydrolase-like protein with peptidoglycan-binding domain